MPLGKKYKAAIASYDIEAAFSPSDALNKAKTMATAKFDELKKTATDKLNKLKNHDSAE